MNSDQIRDQIRDQFIDQFIEKFNLKYKSIGSYIIIDRPSNFNDLINELELNELIITKSGYKFVCTEIEIINDIKSINKKIITGMSLEDKGPWIKDEMSIWNNFGFFDESNSGENIHDIAFIIKRKNNPEYFL